MTETLVIIFSFLAGLMLGLHIGVKAGLRKAIEMTEEAFPNLKSKGQL